MPSVGSSGRRMIRTCHPLSASDSIVQVGNSVKFIWDFLAQQGSSPFSAFPGDAASEFVRTLYRLLRGLGRSDYPASVSAFEQGGGS